MGTRDGRAPSWLIGAVLLGVFGVRVFGRLYTLGDRGRGRERSGLGDRDLDPSCAAAYVARAKLLRAKGDEAKAKADLERAAQLDPSSVK